MTETYVPGTLESDPKKIVMSLQQIGPRLDTANGNITTNTANIATNTANIATNTAAIAKLSNNQFARVYLNGNQTGISLSSFVLVNLNAVSFDPSSIWDNVNKRFLPTIAGYYKVGFCASLNWSGAGTQAIISIHKNGSIYAYGANTNPNGTFIMANGTDIVHFDGSTDYVDMRVYSSGGASRNIDGASHLTYMSICLVKAD